MTDLNANSPDARKAKLLAELDRLTAAERELTRITNDRQNRRDAVAEARQFVADMQAAQSLMTTRTELALAELEASLPTQAALESLASRQIALNTPITPHHLEKFDVWLFRKWLADTFPERAVKFAEQRLTDTGAALAEFEKRHPEK